MRLALLCTIGLSYFGTKACGLTVYAETPDNGLNETGSEDPEQADKPVGSSGTDGGGADSSGAQARRQEQKEGDEAGPIDGLKEELAKPNGVDRGRCQIGASTHLMMNLFQDMEGCSPRADKTEVLEGLSYVSRETVDGRALADATLGSLRRFDRAVTACQIQAAARRLEASTRGDCSRGESGWSNVVTDIMQQVVEPQIQALAANPAAVGLWDSDLMAAVIVIFGSPERYNALVAELNSSIQNKDHTELDTEYFDRMAWLFGRLDDYKALSTKTGDSEEPNWERRSYAIRPERFSFGESKQGLTLAENFNVLRASDDFKRAYLEFHNLARRAVSSQQSDAKALLEMSLALKNLGMDHAVERFNGTLTVVPQISLFRQVSEDEVETLFRRLEEGGLLVLENE